MKLNRKRKDARFPNWILEMLASLQTKYQWTFTEALIRCAEKGAAYYNKQWMKMHPNQKGPSEEGPSIETEELSDPQEKFTPEQIKNARNYLKQLEIFNSLPREERINKKEWAIDQEEKFQAWLDINNLDRSEILIAAKED